MIQPAAASEKWTNALDPLAPDRRARRLVETTYWALQVLGWGLWTAVGLLLASRGGRLEQGVVVGYLLFWGYSIALTHGLRLWVSRAGWLNRGPGVALVRLVPASLLTSTVQTALVVLLDRRGNDAALAVSLEVLLFLWMNISFGTAVWSALYAGAAALWRGRSLRLRNQAIETAFTAARLRLLESQMSPHFLFNSLNSIRGYVREDPARAQDAITRLANLLRSSLQRSAVTSAPLADELALAEDYLALESMRFEERLRVRREIEPATLPLPVPCLVLQTLVENAIKHGIANRPDGGEVCLRSWLGGEGHCIEVLNPGRLGPADAAGTHQGLANVRERLAILHGARARLELCELDAETVVARLLLPLAATGSAAAGNGDT